MTAKKKTSISAAPSHEISLTPFRLKVVELASQMASSQIAATAYSEASRSLVSSVHRIAANYLMASARLKSDLEMLEKCPEGIEAGWVDRAVAMLELSANTSELAEEIVPMHHSRYDLVFQGALARAEMLLTSPLEDRNLVFAEQLFLPGEVLTENQIRQKFHVWDWPTLKSTEPFHDFIIEVENWFYDRLHHYKFSDKDEQSRNQARMLMEVLRIGRGRAEDDCLRQIVEIADRHQQERLGSFHSSSEMMVDHAWHAGLIEVLYCGQELSKVRGSEIRTHRRRRPWGLFRYLRLWGDEDSVGSKLAEFLSCPRSTLQSSSEPFPIDGHSASRYDFGMIGKEVDGKLADRRTTSM